VTGNAWLAALGRPTTVAVHNDRDVTRQTIPSHGREQRLFSRSFLNYSGEVRKHETERSVSRSGATAQRNPLRRCATA
jgi:hypothetical protein